MTQRELDETMMAEAIRLSALAVEHGNEPFASVLVKDGEIVFTNENQIYTAHDPTFHGETGLLRRFFAETGITDLREYTLYSNMEPCFMCCGAMVWAQLGRLVYGGSDIDLCKLLGEEGNDCAQMVFSRSHHRPRVTAGVLRQESIAVAAAYFAKHKKG